MPVTVSPIGAKPVQFGRSATVSAPKAMALNAVRFGAEPADAKAPEAPKNEYQSQRLNIKVNTDDPESGQLRWEQLFTLTRKIKGLFDVPSATDKVADDAKPTTDTLGLTLTIGGRDNFTAKTLRENKLNGWISGWTVAAREAIAVFYYKAKHAIMNAGGFWSGISKVGEMLFGSPKEEDAPKPAAATT